MMITLGSTAPDFTAQSTHGTIRFHEWISDDWCLFFSHPKDFTPVCSTEVGSLAKAMPELNRRGVKVIGLSVDTVDDHNRWLPDVEAITGHRPDYPLIGDHDLAVSKLYGMLEADDDGEVGNRTAADNATVRNVYIIGPDKKIKLMMTYPMTTGRNFEEMLRVIDSLQLTATHQLATPANWKPGDDVIIVPSVSDDEARKRFPQGWEAPRPYVRLVPQPE